MKKTFKITIVAAVITIALTLFTLGKAYAEIGTNDPLQSSLWALDNSGQTVGSTAGTAGADMAVKQAWGIFDAATTSSVIVGIVDSGIAYNHPDLLANMWDGTNCVDQTGAPLGGCLFGYSFIAGSKDSLPVDDSHGTRIAGIIGAVRNNNIGITGVAPNVKMISVAAADNSVGGANGVNFAAANGAKIINASWGGYAFDQNLKDAITNFQGLIVFSAGNNTSNHDTDKNNFPCDWNLPNAICVAATDQNDNLASFSDFGATTVDIGAPGTNITSTNDDITPYAENFDGVPANGIPANFTVKGGGNWGVKNSGAGGGNALFGDLNVPYASSTDSTISAPAVNLSKATAATISFSTACYTKDVPVSPTTDHMSLEASADGISFDEIKIWNKNTLDNGVPAASSSPLVFMKEALPKKYFTDSFIFRFRWFTDSADNTGTDLSGCFIDNISIDGFSDGSDQGYATARSGTSYSAAYVSGLAALIWGMKPDFTAAQVKNLILNTGTPLASLAGKTITGKRVNAFNALRALSAKAITAFSFPAGAGVINETNHTIAVTVPFGTKVSALAPTISTSSGASVSPASGVAQDFTKPVIYTVTAADGSTQAYAVTVTVAPDTTPPPPPPVPAPTPASGGAVVLPPMNAYTNWLAQQLPLPVAPAPASVAAPVAPAAPAFKPILPQILGVKYYGNGSLIRGQDRKIYLIRNNKLVVIRNLAQLRKYAGQKIYDAPDPVIRQYMEFFDGQLIRGQDKRIYVIKKGRRQTIFTLTELREKYLGQKIYDISDQILTLY